MIVPVCFHELSWIIIVLRSTYKIIQFFFSFKKKDNYKSIEEITATWFAKNTFGYHYPTTTSLVQSLNGGNRFRFFARNPALKLESWYCSSGIYLTWIKHKEIGLLISLEFGTDLSWFLIMFIPVLSSSPDGSKDHANNSNIL